MSRTEIVEGRLVLDDRITAGRILIEDDRIVAVEHGEPAEPSASSGANVPYIAPGFVDVHVHGGGGHDAMGGAHALDGMARHLLRHGVTSFLPTAVTAPLAALDRFAEQVRTWLPQAPTDGAQPLGFDLEGPFLAPARRGAHDPAHLRVPADVARRDLEPLLDGLRLVTIAPELPGALDLIGWLHERGIATSMGHSAADFDQARAGFAAGGTSTTHLFNAMTGVDHHAPGLAVAALGDDAAYVELIADGEHVHPSLWPIITRTKPADRVMLVSDAISLAGMGDGRASIGGLAVEVVGQRVTLVGTTTLAGSVIALDAAVRNLVQSGASLPYAVAAAGRNPLAMLGVTDRGRLEAGQRADLVQLDDRLRVSGVMRAGTWFAAEVR
ncbi:MAG TPA: N-acetylglucosamine-6-phosphate deacetylase [Candidatus Limnocylindrales bacterium]|nr:N-acetylglucosamine-6-phosphate deacetylase [Candidatus Limnocylindrales bacterium]